MKFNSLFILLPCHSLEDFPVHFTGEEATGLLENWIALWHPELISSATSLPQWHRAEEAPEDLTDSLVLIPAVSSASIPDTLEKACENANALPLKEHVERETIVQAAFEKLNRQPNNDPDHIADFYALGYGYLQVQLMTRQLRYSSNLDEDRFAELVLTAANSASGSAETFRENLQACFDLLLEEKSRYYPVEANLVDLTLVADTTLGKSLRSQLERDFKQNLLLTGRLCEQLEAEQPETFHTLESCIASERVQIVGGNQRELPDPLVSSNSLARNLAQGRKSINKSLGVQPGIYVRRTAGLTPVLPELLEKFCFQGVLHATLDDGRFPTGLAANTRWEAPSGESLIALTSMPRDANVAESFLNLGLKIGEAIDSEHYATVVFAHWPNRFNPVFEDLLRIHRYGPLLGNFVTFAEHFESVYDPGYGESHKATEYRTAYLQQAIASSQADPISRVVRYWSRTWRLRELQNMRLISSIHNNLMHSTSCGIAARIDADLIENADDALDDDMAKSLKECQHKFTTTGDNTTVINTLSFSRMCSVDNKDNAKPSSAVERIHVRDRNDGGSRWVVNCPSMGHCELVPQHQSKRTKLGPAVVEDGGLQNEFFRLNIDEKTGGMRGLKLYDRRTNILTQRLAMRKFSGHPKLDSPEYSDMVAKQIDFVPLTHVAGKVVSMGELILENKVVAEFQQTIAVTRGSRNIEFEIEFDSVAKFEPGNGWDNYLCSRIAWAVETAEVRRELHSATCKTRERRLCAPQFLEIDDLETKLTLIAGGLPYHQRSGTRQLDSLLVCGGETNRRFRFAIAVNEKYSSQAVANWHTPPSVLNNTKVSSQPSGWLFHFSSKNIMVTMAETISGDNAQLQGVHFRLQETEGRRGDLTIHCPRKITSAHLANLAGDTIENLKFEDDKVKTDFLGSQMLDLVIHW